MGSFKDMNPWVKATVVIGGAALLIGGGIVINRAIVRRRDKSTLLAQGNAIDASQNANSLSGIIFGNTPTTCKHCVKDAPFPLKYGSKGKQVAAIQYAFNLTYPNSTIKVDGDWGPNTQNAVDKLSKKYGVSLSQLDTTTYNKIFKKYETA